MSALFACGTNETSDDSLFVFDANERLFTVYAFMNAAGYDHEWRQEGMHPIRVAVREHLQAALPPEFKQKIREFYQNHDGGFNGYGSYALRLTDAPPFDLAIFDATKNDEHIAQVVNELPGLNSLLTEFHRAAGIDTLWQRYRPQIQAMNDEYRPFADRALRDIIEYCRVDSNFYSRSGGKIHFTICPQMSHFTAFTVEIKSDVYIVHGPSSGEPGPGAFYHEALHHVTQPLIEKHSEEIERLQELYPISQKEGVAKYGDWSSVVDESFVRTIAKILEGRYYQDTDELIRKSVEDEYKLGFILCRHLYESFPAYEKSGETLETYFPKLLSDVDLEKEKQHWHRFWQNQI